MSDGVFSIKQDSDWPALLYKLRPEIDGSLIDSVKFSMWNKDKSLIIDQEVVSLAQLNPAIVSKTFTKAQTGAYGVFEGEFTVTLKNAAEEGVYPSRNYITINIPRRVK